MGDGIRSDEFHRPDRRGIVAWIRPSNPEQKLHDALKSYVAIRLHEFQLRVAAKICRIVDAEVTTLVEQLDRLSLDLSRLSNSVPGGRSAAPVEDSLTNSSTIVLAYRTMLREQLQLRQYDIARTVDETAQRQFSAQGKDLRKFLDPVADLHQAVWQPLVQIARRCVLDAVQDVNRQLLAASRTECASMHKVLELLRAKVVGTTGDRSGATTKCLVVPQGTDTSSMSNLSSQTTIVEGTLIDITLGMIEQPAPLVDLASELTDGVKMYKDLSNRLLTRVDINWSELDDVTPAAREPDHNEFAGQGISPTAVLPVR